MSDKPLSDQSIGYHVERVQAAQRTYEREVEALQRSDKRGPIYSAIEQQEREQSLRAERDARIQPALDLAQSERDEALRRREDLEDEAKDYIRHLGAEGQAKAASLSPFVRSDIMQLPPARLAARVRSVAASGDQPYRVVLFRALTERLEELRANDGAVEQRRQLAELAALIEPTLKNDKVAAAIEQENLRFDQAGKLRQQVHDVTRAEHVAELQDRLVRTGQYAPMA